MNPGACVNPGQPPSAEADRQPGGRGELESIPGQLTLPGMPSPAEAVGGQATLPGLEPPAAPGLPDEDGPLAAVAAELRALDGDGSRMAAAIRGALDMLLDGQHTGRYRWDQLHKTENLVHNREPAGRARAFGDGTHHGAQRAPTTSRHVARRRRRGLGLPGTWKPDGTQGGLVPPWGAEAVIQLHAQASWIFRMAARRSSTDRVLSTGSR
ncbi:MAG: NaeI family type II restriction endonuclease [Streptosporangiaceae bacterium]